MKIKCIQSTFETAIRLSSSKSESNRALMIHAYSGGKIQLLNLSDAADTVLLISLLDKILSQRNVGQATTIDCQNAGTVYRFLLTYLANKPGNWILTGSERMKQRPINDLVDTLVALGASIQYLGDSNFPPLSIVGKKLHGGHTTVSIEKSSQFASSLMLAAPYLEDGLHIELTGNPSSMPYIDMTVNMMRLCGAEVSRVGSLVTVAPKGYRKANLSVSADWSGAAFWFELVALSENGRLNLEGLSLASEQGDKALVGFYKMLGVECEEYIQGLRVWKSGKVMDNLCFNLRDFPDLLPALAVTCAGLGVGAYFIGLENLVIKESNRTKALEHELAKIGVRCSLPSAGELVIQSSGLKSTCTARCVSFESYNDHRMAMALASLAMVLGELEIQQAEAVSKSYPQFWNELLKTRAVSID